MRTNGISQSCVSYSPVEFNFQHIWAVKQVSLWAPVTPYYLLFLCQVLFHFETEHQFKQEAIIAEAIGPLEGPEAVKVPPAMEVLVKTRQRQ